MSRVLITGATGFVGRALVPALLARGHRVVSAVRPGHESTGAGTETRLIGNIGPETDWRAALEGIEAVVHLAARVHVMREEGQQGQQDPKALYRLTNAEGTRRLAVEAAAAGVTRLVFLSTVKVNGEQTPAGPFTEADPPRPVGPYAESKLAAEEALVEVAAETGIEVAVLRSPLVYGEGVGGNFLSLLKLCRSAPPLPFSAVKNGRSLIYLGNLVDAIAAALEHPAASGKTFLLRDGEDLSTPALIRLIAGGLGRPARLFPLPLCFVRFLAGIAGKSTAIERLLVSLRVDDEKIRRELGWTPPFTVLQGLGRTAAWFAADGINTGKYQGKAPLTS
jgi:nucleoside-diphosphate-sugar epimerase